MFDFSNFLNFIKYGFIWIFCFDFVEQKLNLEGIFYEIELIVILNLIGDLL